MIKGAILDDNVSIGDNCQITNKDGITEADRTEDGYVIQDGIVTILRNAAIPSGVRHLSSLASGASTRSFGPVVPQGSG